MADSELPRRHAISYSCIYIIWTLGSLYLFERSIQTIAAWNSSKTRNAWCSAIVWRGWNELLNTHLSFGEFKTQIAKCAEVDYTFGSASTMRRTKYYKSQHIATQLSRAGTPRRNAAVHFFSFNCHFQINDDLQVFAVFCKAKQSTEVQSMKSLPAKEADPARASRAPIRVPIPARVFQTTERDPTKSSRCLAEVGSIQCEYLTVHCPFLAMCFQRVSTNSLNEQVLNKVSSTLLRLEFPRPRDSCAETSCGKYCTCFFV